MAFRKAVDDSIYAFFLLGQSSYNPRVKVVRIQQSFVRFIPTIILWITSTCLSIYTLSLEYKLKGGKGESMLMSHLWVVLEQAVAFTIVGSSFGYNYLLPQIYLELEMLERILKHKLKITVDLRQIPLRFRRKMMVIILMHAFTLLTRLPIVSENSTFLLGFVYKIQVIVGLLPIYHALFYVTILRQFQLEFSTHVAVVSNQNFDFGDFTASGNGGLLRQLRQWRQVHFQLRKCFDIVNEYFGWILVTSSLYMLYYIIWSIYWATVSICEGKSSQFFR